MKLRTIGQLQKLGLNIPVLKVTVWQKK